jgi:hypothetical protein
MPTRAGWRTAGLAGLLTAMLAACQPVPPPQRLAVAGTPLEVPLPYDWRAGPGVGADLYMRPVEQGQPIPGAFLLVVHDEPRIGDASLDSYLAFRLEREARATPRQEVLRQEALSVSGHPAIRVLRRVHGPLATRMVLTQYLLADGRGWTLTASCSVQDWPRLKPQFRHWLDGVSVSADGQP